MDDDISSSKNLAGKETCAQPQNQHTLKPALTKDQDLSLFFMPTVTSFAGLCVHLHPPPPPHQYDDMKTQEAILKETVFFDPDGR